MKVSQTGLNPENRDFKEMNLEEKIMSRTAGFKVPEGKTKDEALRLLKTRISESGKEVKFPKSRNMRMIYLVTSVAAALLILLTIRQVWIKSQETRIIAGMGTHNDYRLPDGSRIRLNADSRIKFNRQTYTGERNIKLDGEAFFEVEKGSQFTVSTNNGEIKVLGTSFNVFSRDNSFRVSCLTGKVMVTSGKTDVTITPGESVLLSENNLVKYDEENVRSVTGWIDGEFSFKNSPLNDVISEIERQFNVKFAGNYPVKRYFTGSFTNKDLRVALDILCIPLGLRYEIGSNGKISIMESGK